MKYENYFFKPLYSQGNCDVVPLDLYTTVCNGYVTEGQGLIFIWPVDLLKTISHDTNLEKTGGDL